MKTPAPKRTMRWLMLYPVALWLWMGWACAQEWIRNPNYQYGLLMLPLAAYFFAKRMGDFAFAEDLRPSLLAWATLFSTAVLIAPVEVVRLSPLYWRLLPWSIGLLAVCASFAAARIIGGRALIKTVSFPVVFLLLAIPWPTVLEQRTTLPLMNVVTHIVGQSILFIGIPAQVSGSTILLPNCIIGIEEACSGLRSFQTALVIGLAAGELFSLTFRRRIGLLLVSIIFAFGGNILRTFILAWAGYKGGKAQVEHFHDPTAWSFLVLLVFFIFLLAKLLHKPMPPQDIPVFKKRKIYPSISPVSLLLLWVLGSCGFLLAQGWYVVEGGWHPREVGEMLSESSDSRLEVMDPPKEVQGILAPTRGKYFRSDNAGKFPLSAYHFYWAPSRSTAFQVYHRPDICMPGAGWQQTGPVTRMTFENHGMQQSWYVFPYERNNIRAFLLWSAWMDGSPMEFHFNEKMPVQRSATLRFIANGKRKVSYEVAAVLIPYEADTLPEDIARQAVETFFDGNENTSSR